MNAEETQRTNTNNITAGTRGIRTRGHEDQWRAKESNTSVVSAGLVSVETLGSWASVDDMLTVGFIIFFG